MFRSSSGISRAIGPADEPAWGGGVPKGDAQMPARVIAVAVRKGGAGKTTTTANLGVAIAQVTAGPVLLVDLDSQANLTRILGQEKRGAAGTINEVLFGDVRVEEAVVRTPYGVDLIPAGLDLAAAEKQLLLDPVDPNMRLREAFQGIRESYGYILIDCPPTLGSLTLNALVAADEVLVPFEPNALGTDGISETLNLVQRVQKRLNPGLRVSGLLANRFDSRATLPREVLEQTMGYFAGRVRVFGTVVPEAVSLQEAVGFGVPAAFYRSRNACHRKALQAYRELALELAGLSGEEVEAHGAQGTDG